MTFVLKINMVAMQRDISTGRCSTSSLSEALEVGKLGRGIIPNKKFPFN
jgi:hypothetical protein